jgi:Ca2+-binding RTX toxin-like protein
MFGGAGNDSLASSGAASITMVGGAGADTLTATNDTNVLLQGGDGTTNPTTAVDILAVTGGASITMFGGAGNDSLTATGATSITMIGGTGSDTLTAVNATNALLQATDPGMPAPTAADVLTVSGGASITMFGGAGNDSLAASGAASITMVGGAGNDTLTAINDTNALLLGGDGTTNPTTSTDVLTATGGASITMFGGAGNDSLAASGAASITMVGGAGNDTLTAINDTSALLLGGDGTSTPTTSTDVLTATGGASITMFGGAGNDSLTSSGAASITMVGGAGADVLTAINDTNALLQGGDGTTTPTTAIDTLTVSGGASITMFGGAGNDSLTASGATSITMIGGAGADTLTATNDIGVQLQAGDGTTTPGGAPDLLTASGGASITMFGGAGNDSMTASAGTSITMIGGAGSDTMTAANDTSALLQAGNPGTGLDNVLSSTGGTSITMFGGAGDDSLSTSGGVSITMAGGASADTLTSANASVVDMIGGAGNATLTATGGASITMFGGAGDDSLAASGATSITMIGGTGADSLSSTAGSIIDMIGGSGNATLTATGGASITMFGGTGDDSLAASGAASITMVGGAGADSLSSTGGSIIDMIGGTGNSTLTATGGASITMFGGAGDDSLAASGAASITMVGGTGADTLTSTSTAQAPATDILMIGGAGNATLTATGGVSITMFGGAGNDSLASSGAASITMIGGAGADTLTAIADTGALIQANDAGAASTAPAILTVSGGASITMFGGAGNDSLTASGATSITMVGGAGADTLTATSDVSVILQGSDATASTTAPDILTASGGTSITMFGGTGNDSLAASGATSITMIGGSGADTLTASGDTSALLEAGATTPPLNPAVDILSVTGGTSITMFGGAGDDSLTASGAASVTMVGGTASDTLTAVNDISVLMQAGNPAAPSTGVANVLTATGGASITMFGGAGNDSLAASGAASVTMSGGAGNDTLASSTMTQTTSGGTITVGGVDIYMLGGDGNDVITATGGASITMFGGAGDDSLAASGATSITMMGGAGQDSLSSTADTSIYMLGGTGNSTLTATGGTSITMFGGTGNDSLASSGGTSVTMIGGSGNDSLTSTDPSTIYMLGGTGNSTLTATGGTSITMFGGTGNDSLASSGGTSVTMIGGTGSDTLTASNDTSTSMQGGSGNDSLQTSGGASIYLLGGTGNSTLSATGGTSITMFGGTGNDSLASSGGTSITLIGGSGADTLTSTTSTGIEMVGGAGNASLGLTGGTSITMFGGAGNDSLAASGATSVTMIGGSGNDSLASTGDASITMIGGTGLDTLTTTNDNTASVQAGGNLPAILSSTGGTSITMFGGAGNDVLSATGGASIHLYGLEGNNVYQVTGTAANPIVAELNDLATFGQNQATTDGKSVGVNTILFPNAPAGIHLDLSNASSGGAAVNPGDPGSPQNVIPGAITLSLTGQFQNVAGTPFDDYIHGGASSNLLWGGPTGNDTLVGGTGPATLLANSGNDSLVAGPGGTTFLFDPNPGFAPTGFGNITVDPPAGVAAALDFSRLPSGVNVNLASTAPQLVNPATHLNLTLQDAQEINGVITGPYDDQVTGNSAGDQFYVGGGHDTFTGGGGHDTFYYQGNVVANTVINESSTGNALNFLNLDGPINLDLGSAAAQHIDQTAASSVTLTLNNPLAFNTVIGTPYADTIKGNDAATETIIGAGGSDMLTAGSGNDSLQGFVTQVVYLDFNEPAPPNAHIYTAPEQNAVLQRLQADYADFNYFFTLNQATAAQVAQATGGRYATLEFNQGSAGGSSTELDPGNFDLGGTSLININPFLGDQPGLVPVTSANIIGLTTTIAAHELGHLSGLQHQDAFEPIGTGLFTGVNSGSFNPPYTGSSGAVETPFDIMASPASVGTTLLDAAGPTYFGERDAIKLAFNDTGTALQGASLPLSAAGVHVANPPAGSQPFTIGSARTIGALPTLAVPNTLPAAARDYADFSATTFRAVAVNDSVTVGGQHFYAFTGQAGQTMTLEVISRNNTLNPLPFPPEMVLVDSSGNVLAYNAGEFESSDATILDFKLPASGTYYVGVDSVQSQIGGDYQLFLYSTETTSVQAGGDTLVGGSGNDLLTGSSGNDHFVFQPGSTGHATIVGGSGQDQLTLSGSPNEIVSTTGQFAVDPPILLTGSPNPVLVGHNVTFTVDITPVLAGIDPTGSVDLIDTTTAQTIGTAPLAKVNGVEQATITASFATAVSHSVKARYHSDTANYLDNDSNSIAQNVSQQVAPTFVFDPASLTAAYDGHAHTVTAEVYGEDNLDLGPATITFQGLGQNLPVNAGAYPFTASFAGSSTYPEYLTATAAGTFTISQDTLTVAASAETKVYGSLNPALAYTFSGFVNNENSSVVTGAPSLTTTATTTSNVGVYPINVAVGSLGATNYMFAFTGGTLTVNQDATTTGLTATTASQTTLTATVTANSPGSGTPTGAVTFFDTTTNPATNLGTVGLVNGAASLTTTLPPGSRTVMASYNGDGNFIASSSSTVTTVTAAAIYILNPSASGALTISGSASITVPGAIDVDSTSATAIIASGNASVTAARTQVAGGYSKSGGARFTPTPITGAQVVADPLAALPMPIVTGSVQSPVVVSGSTQRTISPGIYSQIAVSGNGVLTMNPGVYVIAGGGFAVSGNGAVNGNCVLIYNAGAGYTVNANHLGGAFGAISLTGNGHLALSAPSTGTYAGDVLFQARDNTQTLTLSGNDMTGVVGAIYAPNALLAMSGNAHLNDALIIGTMNLSGNAVFNTLAAPDGLGNSAGNSSGGGSTSASSGAVASVAFASAAQTVGAGRTSGVITLQLEDAAGNPAHADRDLPVSLSSNSGAGVFLDAAGNVLTAVTIPASQGSVSIRYQDANVGVATLTAAGAGLSATQQEIVTGAPSTVIFTSLPQTLTAGQVGHAVTVELEDATGNRAVAPAGGVTLTLTSTSNAGVFLDAAGNVLNSGRLTIPAGASSATFLYQDGDIGLPTLTAALGDADAVQQETVTAGAVAYTPAQIRTAYGFNNLTLDGTGQTIAIVDAYSNPSIFHAVDLFDQAFGATTYGPTFYQQYGPASSFLTVLNQDGAAGPLPGVDPSGAGGANWEMEESLDVQWIHAMAPGAHIVLVEAGSESLANLMAGVAAAARQPGVSVVSMSWGFVEGSSVLQQDEAIYDHTFSVPGVTFVASTGDRGSGMLEYPAASPNVLAVGGSSLYLNADDSYNHETGWGSYSSAIGGFIGSGGGTSLYEPEPTYQQLVQSTGNRSTPDVSFVADVNTGAWIADPYNRGESNPWQIAGGTSLSAPSWAGLIGVINQGRVAAGEPTLTSDAGVSTQQGLYSLPAADFHSITAGTNGAYSASAGYNLVTGLGTPAANLLVPDMIAYQTVTARNATAADMTPDGAGRGTGLGNSNTMTVFNAVVVGDGAPAPITRAAMPATVTRPTSTVFSSVPTAAVVPTSTRAADALDWQLPAASPAQNVVPTWPDVSARLDAYAWPSAGVPGNVPASSQYDSANDVLIGGEGDDLQIGNQKDVLIGGFTSHLSADAAAGTAGENVAAEIDIQGAAIEAFLSGD